MFSFAVDALEKVRAIFAFLGFKSSGLVSKLAL